MTSKSTLTPVPGSPPLVRRVVPVVAAAAVVTGCVGCPGGVRQVDAYTAVFDAGRTRPPDAYVMAGDAGISVAPSDVGVAPPADDAAVIDDAPADDAGR